MKKDLGKIYPMSQINSYLLVTLNSLIAMMRRVTNRFYECCVCNLCFQFRGLRPTPSFYQSLTKVNITAVSSDW